MYSKLKTLLVLIFTTTLVYSSFAQTCINITPIDGTPCSWCAPAGWVVGTMVSPDIISGNGPWPSNPLNTIADVNGTPNGGGNFVMYISYGSSGEYMETTLVGLTPGQLYSFNVEWQQATEIDKYGVTSSQGGQLDITVDGISSTYISTGGINDNWQIATKTFTANTTTANVKLGIVPGSGAIGGDGMIVTNEYPCTIILDTVILCQGDSIITDGNMEYTAGIYGDTLIQILNPNITSTIGILCTTSTPVSLSGTPIGGTWNGTGITGNSFDPATAGAGGPYSITYTTTLGTTTCYDTLFATVTANPLPGTDGTANLCLGAVAINLFDSLGGSPSTGGIWTGPSLPANGDQGTLNPSTAIPGVYTYIVNDCTGNPILPTAIVTVSIDTCTVPVAAYIINNSTICIGDCITLTDQSAEATSWAWTFSGGLPSTANTQGPHEVCFNTAGIYTVQQIVSNNNGADTLTSTIEVNPTPTINAGLDVTIDLGESTTLIATGSVGTYTWSPPTWLSCYVCSSTTSTPEGSEGTIPYTVTIVDSNGCLASDEVSVTIDQNITLFIPNVFSPNGDGNNDVFYVKGVGIQIINFLVYNRWGELMFESQNIGSGWDGTYLGKSSPEGTYVYIIEYSYLKQNNLIRESKIGSITLLK